VAHTIAGGSNGSRGLSSPSPLHFNHCLSTTNRPYYAARWSGAGPAFDR